MAHDDPATERRSGAAWFACRPNRTCRADRRIRGAVATHVVIFRNRDAQGALPNRPHKDQPQNGQVAWSLTAGRAAWATCELGALLSELAVYEISVQSARDEFRAFCSHARMRDVPCRGRCCPAVRHPHEAGPCDPYSQTSRIVVASPGEALGWHVKNWLANRISKVGRFRWAEAACVNAVGPAGGQARGRMEMRWQNGTPWDSAGLSGTGFPGLGALTWVTRNSRTRGGQNAGFTQRGMEK